MKLVTVAAATRNLSVGADHAASAVRTSATVPGNRFATAPTNTPAAPVTSTRTVPRRRDRQDGARIGSVTRLVDHTTRAPASTPVNAAPTATADASGVVNTEPKPSPKP